jgi:hypothetical protein
MLLMLEDNVERMQRFTEVLRTIDPGLPLLVWRDAKAMMREVRPYLPAARVISLDHELEPLEDRVAAQTDRKCGEGRGRVADGGRIRRLAVSGAEARGRPGCV